MTIRGTKGQPRRFQNLRKVSNSDRSQMLQQNFGEEDQINQQEFTILKTLNEGEFSKIYLARPELGSCKKSLEQALVLKACNKDLTNADDFSCEMDINYFLSPHPNITTSYNISFTWGNYFMYPQEFAPYGDLWTFLKKNGGPFPETQVKLVAQQLSCALEFIHSLNLVHRDVVPENVLVFQKDLSLIKLSDFGSVVSARSLVTKNSNPYEGEIESPGSRPRRNANGCGKLAYLPPEISTIIPQEKYYCYPSVDVWQFGILLFVCLSGSAPWRCADVFKDSSFNHYCDWIKRRCIKAPIGFQPFTCRLIRLFKRLLEPKPTKRCRIQEVSKYLKDDWLGGCKSSMLQLTNLIGKGMEKSPSTNNGFGIPVGRSKSDTQGLSSYKKKANNVTLTRKSEKVRGTKRNEQKEPAIRISCTAYCKKVEGWGNGLAYNNKIA